MEQPLSDEQKMLVGILNRVLTNKRKPNVEQSNPLLRKVACLHGDNCQFSNCRYLHSKNLFGKAYSWTYVFKPLFRRNRFCQNGPYCVPDCALIHPRYEKDISECFTCGMVAPIGWHNMMKCQKPIDRFCLEYSLETCSKKDEECEKVHLKSPSGIPAFICLECAKYGFLSSSTTEKRCLRCERWKKTQLEIHKENGKEEEGEETEVSSE